MPQICDALVVGSGLLGCATAYYLASAGVRRTIIVDKGPLASGMTRRHAGLVHTHHQDPTTTQLAVSSLDVFRHWAVRIGKTCNFVETGLLVPAEDEEQAARLKRRLEMHSACGAETRLLQRTDLEALFPTARFDDSTVSAFEPSSGYIDPVIAAQSLAEKARELGVRIMTGTMVKKIYHEYGRAAGIMTTTGNIESPVIILTTGAASGSLLAPFGISLNLEASVGVIGFFQQPENWTGGHPAFLDLDSRSFIRPHGFHLTAAGHMDVANHGRPNEPLDDSIGPDQLTALAQIVSHRLPGLYGTPPKRTHAIAYDVSSDGMPLLGRVPGVDGLYLAAGFGANAIVLAPAVGKSLAEWVVDGRPQINLADFSLNRKGAQAEPIQ